MEANHLGVLTGAGISTGAGIPDFRGPKGLYVTKKYDPEKVFDINYFYQDPLPFYEFARDFVGLEQKIQPTYAHRFLSKLEESGKLKGIVTQNIDSLHQTAGSKYVLEIHGSFWLSYCLSCNHEYSYNEIKAKLFDEKIPRCECSGIIKPDIVFFGENVKKMVEAENLAQNSDLFLVMGTSCVVFPAAMIPNHVPGSIIVINQDEVHLPTGNVILHVKEDIDKFIQKVSRIIFQNEK